MSRTRSSRTRQTRPPGSPLRPARALAIAAAGGILCRGGGVFDVPSQSLEGAIYPVEFHEDGDVSCACKDWKKRRKRRQCKHGKAVVFALEAIDLDWTEAQAGEVLPAIPLTTDQQAGLEQLALFQDARRNPIAEPQFPVGTLKYRSRQKKAARIMRERLPRMLNELVLTEEVGRKIHAGRPGLLLHQRAFCALMRVFENRPLADVAMTLAFWRDRGLLPSSPRVNMLCTYMHDIDLEVLLNKLQRRIARVVRNLEHAVVMDSSSLSTVWSANYLDTGRGARIYRARNRWLKSHVAAGPVSSVVSAVELTWNKRGDQTDKSNPTADVNFFLPLLRRSIDLGWNPTMVAADKGYFDEDHYTIPMREMGIRTYIPFKRNTTAAGKSKEMLKMLEMYTDEPDLFDQRYNAIRPKIEGVFSAMKRTTGDFLWSRGALLPEEPILEQLVEIGTSRKNETLGKFIIHSLRQLVLLECMHDESVHFASDRAFEPMADEAKILEEARDEMRADELDDADESETA